MKKSILIALGLASVALVGCSKETLSNSKMPVTVEIVGGTAEFIVPASLSSQTAIQYDVTSTNGDCNFIISGNEDGTINPSAPESGETYKADNFASDNALLAVSCDAGVTAAVTFGSPVNNTKTYSFT